MTTITRNKLVMFLFYFIYIPINFFMSPYLIDKGVDIVTAGLLQTFGLVILIFVLLNNGVIADKIKNPKKVLRISLYGSAFSFFLFLISSGVTLAVISFLMIWMFFMPLAPIIDSIALSSVDSDKYATIRSYGSLGAATSYLMNGFLLGGSVFSYMLIMCIVLSLLMIKLTNNLNVPLVVTKISYKEGIKEVRNNKNLLLIFLVTFLTYGSLTAGGAYQYKFAVDVVMFSGALYGIMGFSSIFLESFIMRMRSTKLSKFSDKTLLMICCILLGLVFMFKATLYMYPVVMFFINFLTGVYIALFVPIVIGMINSSVDGSVRNTVLSLYQISFKIGGVVLGVFTSMYLATTNQIQSIYELHALFVLIAVVILVFVKFNKKTI